jgi:methanogenic corrinoid protein MtbC1
VHIQQQIDTSTTTNDLYEPYVSQLIFAGIVYDEEAVNGLLTSSIKKFGASVTYEKIMCPLLVRLGLLWQKDSICPAQEHFLSSLIRQKLFAAIDQLPMAKNSSKTWLLFLPEDEGHDIGLLYAKYLLRKAGEKVIYLGSHVPVLSLKDAFKKNKVDHLLFFMSHMRLTADAQKYINSLVEDFPLVNIHLSGSHKLIEELTLPENVTWLNHSKALENMINATKLFT